MNRKVLVRFAVAVVALAVLAIGWMAGSSSWDHMQHNDKVVHQAYAVWNDGTTSYGAYCSRNNTVLEGGGRCYIRESSRPYQFEEMVRLSIAAGIVWGLFSLLGGALAFVVCTLFVSLYKARRESAKA